MKPSVSPSHVPTSDPSDSPSSVPTSYPTVNPTASPSHVPTSDPSDSPSNVPTSHPTMKPSVSPSHVPTSPLYAKIQGENYNDQRGIISGGNFIGWFDSGDYLTYKGLNFGPSGTTKRILFRYSKGKDDGKLELRIGGPSGTLIGEHSFANTYGWNTYREVYVQIDDVVGINDLTLVGVGSYGILNIDWFQLSPPAPEPAPLPLYAKIQGENYNDQRGIISGGNFIGWFDSGDYLTYKGLNFGPSGTTKRILFRYSKGKDDGKLELRIGGPSGTLIGEHSFANTYGWNTYREVYVQIDDVVGINDLTLVGVGSYGILNIDWFQLSA